jgi:hypothetical protein
MRPWQTQQAPKKIPPRRIADPAAMIARMGIAFAVHRRFWQVLGRRRSGVCQFHLVGAAIPSWFVKLDPAGAVVVGGTAAAPDATWRSDAASFVALMNGQAGPELLDGGKVRLCGDLDLLLGLFEGLRAPI